MRGRGLTAAAAVLVFAAGALAASGTAPRRFRADLTAASETPAPAHVPHLAGGRFTGRLLGRTLDWTLKFHTLSSKATAADIHLGTTGQTGPVALPLCSPCSSPATGKTKLTGAEIAELAARKLYVDLYTLKNPNGELRGQTYKR